MASLKKLRLFSDPSLMCAAITTTALEIISQKELKCIGIKEGQILEIYKLTEINLVLFM